MRIRIKEEGLSRYAHEAMPRVQQENSALRSRCRTRFGHHCNAGFRVGEVSSARCGLKHFSHSGSQEPQSSHAMAHERDDQRRLRGFGTHHSRLGYRALGAGLQRLVRSAHAKQKFLSAGERFGIVWGLRFRRFMVLVLRHEARLKHGLERPCIRSILAWRTACSA